jgi:hypothetical protein
MIRRHLLLALPFVAGAQAPVRYRISEIVPATVATADGRPRTNRETISIVTIGSRDSAGGVLWILHVDSTASATVSADTGAPRTSTRIVIRRPEVYRAYVRGGRVIATDVDFRAEAFAFNPEQPIWSFMQRVQGVAALPVSDLPTSVDERRSAMSVSNRAVPTGMIRDSSTVQWTRTQPTTIAGSLASVMMGPGPRTRAEVEGTIEIVFDANGPLRSAHWLTQRKRAIGGGGAAPSQQVGGAARVTVERVR